MRFLSPSGRHCLVHRQFAPSDPQHPQHHPQVHIPGKVGVPQLHG